MGFASGFQAGWSAVERGRELSEKRRLQEEFAKVGQDKQYAAYSPAQGAQMTAESEERNPDGSLRYRFEIDPGSTTYRRIENEYNPQAFRTDEYTPILRYPDAQGLGPSTRPVAEAFGVQRPEMSVRREYDARRDMQYQADVDMAGGMPSIPGVTAPVAEPGAIPYGGTPVPMDQSEQAAGLGRDLPTNAPEYSPALYISDPRDMAAYRGLTGRAPGGDTTYSPDREMFLGKSYAPGQLTDEMKMAARQEEYANVLDRAGKPMEAMQMRVAAQAARKNTLEMQQLEATAEKQKNLRGIQANLASWMKSRVGDRQPTQDDFEAFEVKTISDLMAGGHIDEANAAYDRRNRVVMERIKMEEAGRNQAVNAAVFGLSSGDFEPTRQLYDRFLHDGGKTKSVTVDPKDGSVLIKRRTADGVDLPDYRFKSVDELSAAVQSLKDPGAVLAHTQNMFMNNIRERTMVADEKRAAADDRRARAYENRSAAAESRAERADVVYLTDGKNIFEYKRGNLQYDKSGRLQLPEGMSIYKGQGQVSQGSLTKEQETALASLRRDESHQKDMDIIVRAKDPEKVAAAKERVRRRLEANNLPPEVIRFDDRDLAPMP